MSVTETTLGDICRENRRNFPDRIATVDGNVRRSWPQFDARVNRVAAVLADNGVGAGDRVLWLAQTSSRFLETMLACAKLGAMVCPINWRQSASEMTFVIDDFDPRVCLWQDEEIGDTVRAARAGAETSTTWIQHDGTGPDSYEGLVESASESDPNESVSADSPLLVIYTAAIAARPNGSLLTHRNLLTMGAITGRIVDADHTSAFLNSGPLFHIGNFQFESIPVLMMGGANVYVRRVDPAVLLDVIASESVTSAFLMPPTIMAIKELNVIEKRNISQLKAGPFAPVWGDALPADTTLWATRPGGFGQTEVTGLAVLSGLGGDSIGNSGRPSPFCQVRIVDSAGAEVPDGESGEIVIRGDVVHRGYHNRPELNAARTVDGWWRTTDLGRREKDGSIHFIGTMTRMIKSAAENVYPAEVEACIKAHSAVAECALIGVPDAKFGQSVKAVVVLAEGATATAGDIIDHCRAHIASYKKPKSVEFVDVLPKVGGAVDYDALDARFGGGGYPGGSNV